MCMNQINNNSIKSFLWIIMFYANVAQLAYWNFKIYNLASEC